MLAGIIGIGFLVLFVWFLLYIARVQAQKRGAYWNQLAKRHGMKVSIEKRSFIGTPTYLARGSHENASLLLYESYKGSGNHKRFYTNIELPCLTDFSFTISRENVLTKLGATLGFKDISFRREEIDNTFRFKSDDEERFRQLISPALDDLLLIAQHFNGSIECHLNKIVYSTEAQLANEKGLNDIDMVLTFMLRHFG